MRTVTPAETSPVVRGHEGARYVMTDYLGSHTAVAPGEQAYLVQQEAAELRAHFHEVDQFQVVVGGIGSIGRDRAVPGVLHYTDAFTSYGPIRTDPTIGISYLTLRRDPTTGLNYMPEEREKRRRLAGRGEHFTVVLDEHLRPGAGLAELARTGRGARAYGARLASGEALRLEGLPGGQAGYVVVLAGSLGQADRVLPAGSLVSFEDAGDVGALVATASDTPVEAAVLLFPPPA
ncbi:hypothetical protein [Nocardioides sp. W7]|uniref:hypothetical protein n=1 Tax=Nocardioides sp. W7 TaxID=2931390 RepID=UPI001FD47C1D|nr:hypothetical protein [Nocardioides sp. W7]